MDTKTVITTVVSISLAVAGYLLAHYSKMRLDQRAAQLTRVNTQLAELYGPLLCIAGACDLAWRAFRVKLGKPDGAFFAADRFPSERELAAWRDWMCEVFMPANQRMVELVTTRGHLLLEDQVPQCLLDLCAHTAAYQIVMKKWSQGDYSEHLSVINFPSGLLSYAEASYGLIKTAQRRLLEK